MTLKQGESQQTWYELVDPKQGYNHAKFERPPLNSVCPKGDIKAFYQIRKQVNYLPSVCEKVKK